MEDGAENQAETRLPSAVGELQRSTEGGPTSVGQSNVRRGTVQAVRGATTQRSKQRGEGEPVHNPENDGASVLASVLAAEFIFRRSLWSPNQRTKIINRRL
jgi:hypothetical protein